MGATLTAKRNRAERYAKVVELSKAGKGTKEIASILGCCKDLVRYYRRIARANGKMLPVDPYLVNGKQPKSSEGNAKWRALADEG
jgi:hypothetical protein